MIIATWNVERLKHYRELHGMMEEINSVHADILVLTETDTRIKPEYPYCFSTPLLTGQQKYHYADTEKRVSVFSKYKCVSQFNTYDKMTSICVELETDVGCLLLYGTIMGIAGNRQPDFIPDVEAQMNDIRRLTADGESICVIGDYNLSFADNWYYTTAGRKLVNDTFSENEISLLTRDRAECVDHIAVSENFFGGVKAVDEWNYDKSLSDHKGIWVEI